MKIQFNTDKTINGNEKHQDFFTTQITDELKKYQSNISRIEIHVSDENGKKEGINNIRCLLEARLEEKQPIAVICEANNIELALSGAIKKLKASLETILGRMHNHSKYNYGKK